MIDWQVYDFLEYDYTSPRYFLIINLCLFSILMARYFLFSWVYHWFFKKREPAKAQRLLVKGGLNRIQTLKEIKWSFIASLIFSVFTVLIIIGWQNGIIKIYQDLHDYPLWMLPLSLVSILLLQETYYYWLHRWMHKPKVYRLIHKTHHDSIHTSAFTSFSFHPVESLLQALYLPVVLTIVPTYFYLVLFLLIIMTVAATINHAGVEVYPSGRLGKWMGNWLVGSTHHHIHHTKFRYNFGLYFTFWDRWMKTENEDFKENYQEIIK
ncbi:MAG: sterol desaturase family protein [Cyclobacteriaceae bacterium]|nr:sterol desaturase family protein [Cyclobacteriaceae bacterium]